LLITTPCGTARLDPITMPEKYQASPANLSTLAIRRLRWRSQPGMAHKASLAPPRSALELTDIP
jgi:hypothetical protein